MQQITFYAEGNSYHKTRQQVHNFKHWNKPIDQYFSTFILQEYLLDNEGVPPGESGTWVRKPLLVPPMAPSNLTGCKNIALKHWLQVCNKH